jgi:hypothetical protein
VPIRYLLAVNRSFLRAKSPEKFDLSLEKVSAQKTSRRDPRGAKGRGGRHTVEVFRVQLSGFREDLDLLYAEP